MNKISKYILPKGFKASGLHCGAKRYKKDIGIIYSEKGCVTAGVFTQNKVKAAPVIATKEILGKNKKINAVIVNSGNANCCTGDGGYRDAYKMISLTAKALGVKADNVCVASTGIIGKRMPMDIIAEGITLASKKLSERSINDFAECILTTDRTVKMKTVKINVGGKQIIVTGICKGAGMVHPNMATMLCFILTDAVISRKALKLALKTANGKSFNSITVDGDMSTNDCALLLANGAAGNRSIKLDTDDFCEFQEALDKVAVKLAKDIVEDGEGSTKVVTITVKNAKTYADADKAARTIANSCLVKTSIYGQDGNWGRVASSAGASMVKGVNSETMEIYLDGVCMFKNGGCVSPSKKKTSKIYKKKNVEIVVDIKAGDKSTSIFTCDLTKRYIEINAHYTT